MIKKLEQYAKLVIFMTVIDIIALGNFMRFSHNFIYIVLLGILNLISTLVTYLYMKEKEEKIIYLLLVPTLLPIGMIIVLIKKGKHSIKPY